MIRLYFSCAMFLKKSVILKLPFSLGYRAYWFVWFFNYLWVNTEEPFLKNLLIYHTKSLGYGRIMQVYFCFTHIFSKEGCSWKSGTCEQYCWIHTGFTTFSCINTAVLREGFAQSPLIHYKSFLHHTITGKILTLTPYLPEMLNQMYQVC